MRRNVLKKQIMLSYREGFMKCVQSDKKRDVRRVVRRFDDIITLLLCQSFLDLVTTMEQGLKEGNFWNQLRATTDRVLQ